MCTHCFHFIASPFLPNLLCLDFLPPTPHPCTKTALLRSPVISILPDNLKKKNLFSCGKSSWWHLGSLILWHVGSSLFLVVTCRIFVFISYGIWVLVSWPGSPVLGAHSLSHWTTRRVSEWLFSSSQYFLCRFDVLIIGFPLFFKTLLSWLS